MRFWFSALFSLLVMLFGLVAKETFQTIQTSNINRKSRNKIKIEKFKNEVRSRDGQLQEGEIGDGEGEGGKYEEGEGEEGEGGRGGESGGGEGDGWLLIGLSFSLVPFLYLLGWTISKP